MTALDAIADADEFPDDDVAVDVAADHRSAMELELLSALVYRVARTAWRFEEWRQLLLKIDPRCARVVVLHLMHGLGFEEIGERLGFSRGRADQLWRLALMNLSKHLKEDKP